MEKHLKVLKLMKLLNKAMLLKRILSSGALLFLDGHFTLFQGMADFVM